MENKALKRMLADRAQWLKWEKRHACRSRYKAEPAFRATEDVGTELDKSRFEFLAKMKDSHIGVWDKVKNQYAVLRRSSMTRGYGNSYLWELEKCMNKSRCYRRYRGLNDRWRQDDTAIKDYKVVLSEGEDLGIEIKHYGHEDRVINAHVGMLVMGGSYYSSACISRITGVTPDGAELIVQEVFKLKVGALSKETSNARPKSVRAMTMSAVMDWITKLKLIINECDV
jgi:hypothetical protein